MKKFWIVSTKYVGPNASDAKNCDSDTLAITTRQPTTNMSHEPRDSGWLGTTNDVSLTAHGVYDSLELAEAALEAKFPETRECGDSENEFDDAIVISYKIGVYQQWSAEGTANWLYETMRGDITASTTNEELAALLESYESEANSEGGTLDSSASEMLEKFRDDLIADADE